MIDAIQKRLLAEIADLHTVPTGAYNIRANSKLAARNTTANIDIVSKADVSGIDIRIKPGTKKESVHIPVVLSDSGLKETVYNDFYIGEDCDVVIVAGCGIHNCGVQDSEHDGVHRFFVGKNSKVKYVEKHYGEGDGRGKRILNPVTEAYLEEGSSMEMEMVQIKGVDSTVRTTKAELAANASLVVRERLMTHGNQKAKSIYETYLNGDGAAADSRSFLPALPATRPAKGTRSATPSSWTRPGCWRFPSWMPTMWTRPWYMKRPSARLPGNRSSS